jgi:glycosyltransferase involved in cell wall biosynthesis
MNRPNPKTLIYDRDISGHHLDYLQFLIDYLLALPLSIRQNYVFVLNQEAAYRFAYAQSKIDFHWLSTDWITHVSGIDGTIATAKFEIQFLQQLSMSYQANRLVMMHLDAFQLELGYNYLNTGLQIDGILFLPFRKTDTIPDGYKARLAHWLRGTRKALQIEWLLKNPSVGNIFLLNDQTSVDSYNEDFGQNFVYLPDPIDLQNNATAATEILKNRYQIPAQKLVLLIYGNLSPRKNIPHILQSLERLSPEEQAKIVLLLAGEPEKGYEDTLYRALDTVKKQCPAVSFVEHFHFFDPKATNNIFSLTDLVLVPYINFFNSSNVVGLAAKYNKPLIAPNVGVMYELVSKYQLGLCTDPNSADDIASAIQHFLQFSIKIDGLRYCNDHSSATFCQKLLQLPPL